MTVLLIMWGIGLLLQLTGHTGTVGGVIKLVWGDRLVALYFLIATCSQYYMYYTDPQIIKYPLMAIVTGILFIWNAITEYHNRKIFNIMFVEWEKNNKNS